MSNFAFLEKRWPDLASSAKLAEKYIYSDPNASLIKTRLFAERLIDLVYVGLRKEVLPEANFNDKLRWLEANSKINPAVIDHFDIIRRLGNRAAHGDFGTSENAKESIRSAFKLGCWFYVKVTGDKMSIPKGITWPAKDTTKPKRVTIDVEQYKNEIKQLQAHIEELEALKKQLHASPPSEQKVEQELQELTSELNLTEAETRKQLIDVMLREAGWDLNNPDQVQTEYPVETFPNKTGRGNADYVLFDKVGKPIAVIEAKKTMVDPKNGKHQAKLYADALEAMFQTRSVIFYTNGHETYIWDDQFSAPRQIWGFYTLDDLEFLVWQHKSRKSLRTVQIDTKIVERDYQIEGIKRVYESFEEGKRRALMVMATGSGKTRTTIALVKGMLQTGWAKRILFLADRDELVEQAMNKKSSFKTFMPENSRVRIDAATVNNREACIYFATYQTMIKHYDRFDVGFFDLIVADESHRSIYKSYKDIIEYFDAYLLGLTATPVDFINRNTFSLFDCPDGDPTFHYSYEEAYSHIPPYLLKYKAWVATTDFLRKGIHWDELTEEQRRQLEEDGIPEEMIDFDREKLEEFISNYDTNAFIIKTLMEKGIRVGDVIGKTIIFARNIRHATLLAKIFEDLFPQYLNLAAVIHSEIPYHKDLLNDFKEKDRPRIAISVDMLDTGIDVPEVVNLCFAKPVYSKVKFLQMIGRGTRLCSDLFGPGRDKEYFTIFDHWENFKFFDVNPEGVKPSDSKSSMQVRFELRIKLLVAFLKKGSREKQAEIITLLKEDISALPNRSVEVKKHWQALEWLKLDATWQSIDKKLLDVLRLEIAPLMGWVDVEGQLDAIGFDNELHRMELSILTEGKLMEDQKERILRDLHRLPLNLNQFKDVREYVEALKKPEAWNLMNYDDLEKCRKTLRDLMKFRTSMGYSPYLRINVTDTGHMLEEIKDPSAPPIRVDEYIARVETALQNDLDMQLVIYKIRKGEKLTSFDIQNVYRIFDASRFEFSLEEMAKKVQIKREDLEGLLRRFVGVDEEEINKRFDLFIRIHPGISANQIKCLQMIKNDIIRNKGITIESLYQGSYTALNSNGVDGIFDRLADEVFSLIDPYKVIMEEEHA